MASTRIVRPRRSGEPQDQVAPLSTPGSPAELALQLQRSAGNQAVAAFLGRSDGGATVTATTPEQQFAAAVKQGAWSGAAVAIMKVAHPVEELLRLTVDQLRLLQDSLVRLQDKLGPNAVHMLDHVAITLQTKGVPVDKVQPGTKFGELTYVLSPPQNGDPATGKPYEFGISIRFLPDRAAVNAAQIAFIQTARIVDTATGDNRDPDVAAVDRQTGRHSSIDSRRGNAQGWYSMKDDQTANTSLVIWDSTRPDTPAWMLDRPSGTVPNATWDFETAVVCLSGPDAGTVYATLLWGFATDAALKVTPKPQRVTTKQSRDFTHAVEQWNEQAADPTRPQNSPKQVALPAPK